MKKLDYINIIDADREIEIRMKLFCRKMFSRKAIGCRTSSYFIEKLKHLTRC